MLRVKSVQKGFKGFTTLHHSQHKIAWNYAAIEYITGGVWGGGAPSTRSNGSKRVKKGSKGRKGFKQGSKRVLRVKRVQKGFEGFKE